MVGDLIPALLPWLVGAGVVVTVVVSLLFNVSGGWERIPSDAEQAALDADPTKPLPQERITLGQIGPFVRGRRELPGGYQELSGVMLGRTLLITRRDHGVRSLVGQGFPEPIARQLDGGVTGKYSLALTSGGLVLEGSFTPQKIEFTHRPPRITERYFLDPAPRRYRRLTAAERVDELVPATEEHATSI